MIRWCVFNDRASALAATEDSVAQVAGLSEQDAHADSGSPPQTKVKPLRWQGFP